jgi:hypothetical protein
MIENQLKVILIVDIFGIKVANYLTTSLKTKLAQ